MTIKVTIQYTEDSELIEAMCIKDEIKTMIQESEVPEMSLTTKIVVLNPEGEEEI